MGNQTSWVREKLLASAMKRILQLNFSAFLVPLFLQSAICTQAAPASKTNAPPRLTIQDQPLDRDVKARTSFAPIIKKVVPSVVNIATTTTIRERSNPMLTDPWLRRFFGDDSGQSRSRAQKAQSLGSGVIVSPDGYILTANHVVEGAEKITVALGNGEQEFDARVIGTDPPTDVAVIKIDNKKDMPALPLGNSDQLEVGDTVLAIGDPFRIGQTVTMGIVSGIGRGIGATDYEDFIQTDAAINMGNSGGALVDAQGRLMGINTAILSSSGGFQGVGFAVPINLARFVMERIITEGKVPRGYLGVALQDEVTAELAKQFNLPDMTGALVTTVEPNSPADKAGFKEGDIIVQFNGKKIVDRRQLSLVASQTAPGTKVDVKVVREGKARTLTATLGRLPEDRLTRGPRFQPGEGKASEMDSLDGVEVVDLDAQARRQAGISSNMNGALVTNVDPESNSFAAGLRPGDVILEIDKKSVHSADEAVALSEKATADTVLLRVYRPGRGDRGRTLYMPVDNAKRK